MNNIAQKLEYIKWLKSIGIEYYFSTKKDSDISLINELKGHYNKKQEIGSDTIMVNESTKFHTAEKLTVVSNNDGDKEVSSVKEARSLADSISSLDKLKEIVANFNGCTLKNFALNTVFADGNPEAKIMLIGEAPGAKEDEFGIPFCGESGMLLDIMLSTVKLSRKENIYITNTVFWRPPANRKPTKQEINICQPFLEKHIALINPKLIVCVGSTAVTGLFGDKTSINTARNTKHFYQNSYLPQPITTMAIFHPAYLLRQPAKKKDTWFDLIKIQQFIEETI
jgi:DNA polymerase